MSTVRAFEARDIPDVVALRGRVFTKSAHPSPGDLRAYFDRIFFQNPWQTGAQSLVHLDDSGRITGFLGVVGRNATFRQSPIDVAVCTQFMVDPSDRGLAGARLVKTMMAGAQDLAFADVSNEQSRRMWVALGGSVSPTHASSWTQPLRPRRFRAAQRRGLVARIVARLVRPLLDSADRATTRWPAPAGLTPSPLTPEFVAANVGDVVGRATLRTNDDAAATRWLFEQLRVKEHLGTLRGLELRGRSGELVGWYLYYENRGGVGEVVQLVAVHGRHRDVLASLFHDAWKRGLTAVSGRGDANVSAALDLARVEIRTGDAAVLVHSARRDITDAIARGDVFLSRLDGEWWMSF